jgi:hypothetical protein
MIEKPLNTTIKSLKIGEKEILRIFEADEKKITLVSFLHDEQVIKTFYET